MQCVCVYKIIFQSGITKHIKIRNKLEDKK